MIRSRFAISALTGAALLLPLAASGAQAQSYRTYSAQSQVQSAPTYESCMAAQRNRQVAGAVIGGVLGAVVGAEIHDDRQDRDRERHYRGRDRHRDHYGRGSRRGDRYDRRGRGRYEEDGNDGAVLAGAGLGALAGAAVAGRSNGCEHLRNSGYGYSSNGYGNSGYDTGYGYSGQGYDDGYGQQGYSYPSTSSGELLGGESYGYDEPAQPYQDQPYQPQSQTGYESRSYTASASAPRANACRNMQSGNGAVTWMCQGADGVWRPANTY